MASRSLMVGMVTCLAAMAASSADSTLFPRLIGERAEPSPGTAQVRAIRRPQRGAAAQRGDREIRWRARRSVAACGACESGPCACRPAFDESRRAIQAGYRRCDAARVDRCHHSRRSPQQLKTALEGLGLEHAAVFANDVGGWLPVSQLGAATARAEVLLPRAAMSRTRTGAVIVQGGFRAAQLSRCARSNSLTGSGISVGVLSDSYNCYTVYAQSGSGVPASGLCRLRV